MKLHAFADKSFELDMPRKDGTTLRKHVALLAQQGIEVSEYRVPPLPTALYPLWSWFSELCMGRGSNGMGPNALSFTEILAWCQLRQIRLGQFELDALRDLDLIFLKRSMDRDG